MLQQLAERAEIQSKTLQRLQMYFEDESCDSDCIEMDIEDVADSNICDLIQNQSIIRMMGNCIRSTKLRQGAFSTGFIYDYLDWADKQKPGFLTSEHVISVKP